MERWNYQDFAAPSSSMLVGNDGLVELELLGFCLVRRKCLRRRALRMQRRDLGGRVCARASGGEVGADEAEHECADALAGLALGVVALAALVPQLEQRLLLLGERHRLDACEVAP